MYYAHKHSNPINFEITNFCGFWFEVSGKSQMSCCLFSSHDFLSILKRLYHSLPLSVTLPLVLCLSCLSDTDPKLQYSQHLRLGNCVRSWGDTILTRGQVI